MKKFWMLGALALAGFGFMACEPVEEGEGEGGTVKDPEEWTAVDNDKFCDNQCGDKDLADAKFCHVYDVTVDGDKNVKNEKGEEVLNSWCDACQNTCALKTKATPYCVVVGNVGACAAKAECEEGMMFKVENGIATCIKDTLNGCKNDDDCEGDAVCDLDKHSCVEKVIAEDHYSYVRIDDMMGKCKDKNGKDHLNEKGFCTLDDPGADIDAIVLVKADKSLHYASKINAFRRADGVKTLAEAKENGLPTTAADPAAILGEPDSFDTYGEKYDGTCNYWDDPKSADKKHPYVSLGGEGGYIEVQMDGYIEAGDHIDVLEVGECKLKNTSDGGSQTAQADKVKVSIAISDDATGDDWRLVNTLEPNSTNKGILTFDITADMVK